jgi:hypothetical protein
VDHSRRKFIDRRVFVFGRRLLSKNAAPPKQEGIIVLPCLLEQETDKMAIGVGKS